MKNFHPLSFVLGLASGLVVLVIAVGGWRVTHPARGAGSLRANGNFQLDGGGGFNTARMAERLGMTEADLQKELDAGKTFQQIARERGVRMEGFGRRNGGLQNETGSSLPTDSASGQTVGAPASSAPSTQP